MPIKRILAVLFSLVLAVGLCIGLVNNSREEKAEAERIARLNAEASGYENEIYDIYLEIENERQAVSEREDGAMAVLAYYASEVSDLQSEGVILLDAGAKEELVAAAKETGRPVMYFYDPDLDAGLSAEELEARGDGTVLRQQYDTPQAREQITGIISCYADDTEAEVFDNGAVNIPYVYIKNDESDLNSRLNELKSENGVLLVIFNPEVETNREVLDREAKKGNISLVELSEAKKSVESYRSEEQERQAAFEIFQAEKLERIAELEEMVDEVYEKL